MIFSSAPFRRSLRRPTLLLIFCALFASSAWARTDRTFTSPPVLTAETQTLLRLLDEVHYNHANVHPSDYAEVIPDYMGTLDSQRLFFLESDKDRFARRFGGTDLYYKLSTTGDLSVAYDIFNVYNQRVEDRVNWIFAELQKPINLDSNETYVLDRSKLPWPATPADADAIWEKRLRFELIQEMLNKKTLVEARDAVHRRYERMLKNIAEIDGSDLSEMFLNTVTALYDPHSNYFSADTYADFAIQMRLSLVGIGALLASEDGNCVVKEIIPGGPADLSKQLRPNDKIIAVASGAGESIDVIGMKLRKVVDLIRGPKGTQVHLTVIPGDATDTSTRREVTLTRDVVKLNASRARAAIFQVPDGAHQLVPLGVIYLPSFYGPNGDDEVSTDQPSATKDVAELLKRLQAAGIRGLVLDLRGNGGGLLNEAIDLTGLFVGRGPVVQVRSYNGDIKVDSDDDPTVAYTGPLAVLVSRFSASASEIVTGALQNYGRAIIIGDESTHGKGTVQTVVEMKNLIPPYLYGDVKMGAAKFTIQKFYLPNGSSTQLKGVTPDITIPSIDDYLPIGETSLPHALPWDQIPSSQFNGAPLAARIIATLRADSLARQSTLPEFAYLKQRIAWFRVKQDQKAVSLNLPLREQLRQIDDTFNKSMDQERDRLAKTDFTYQEFLLGPKPKPNLKPKAEPKKSAAAASPDDDSIDGALGTDDEPDFAKLDIDLRESLRVMIDAINLGQNRQFWTNDHPPLTAAEVASAKS